MQEIADYFNVSLDYLLGRTDNPRIASDETAIIDGQVVDLRKQLPTPCSLTEGHLMKMI